MGVRGSSFPAGPASQSSASGSADAADSTTSRKHPREPLDGLTVAVAGKLTKTQPVLKATIEVRVLQKKGVEEGAGNWTLFNQMESGKASETPLPKHLIKL